MFNHAEQPLTAETLVRTAEQVGADFMVRNPPDTQRTGRCCSRACV